VSLSALHSGAFDYDTRSHVFPERHEELSRQCYDRRLADAAKARVMAELRAIAGSAWTRADQNNRQLWFGLGGVAAGMDRNASRTWWVSSKTTGSFASIIAA
jgi:hypothetical protein